MENKFKKISSSVVPQEVDFVEAIRRVYQIPDYQLIPNRNQGHGQGYVSKVMSTSRSFVDKLSKVMNEFPQLSEIDPLYASFLHQRHNLNHYAHALIDVSHARHMISVFPDDYVYLMEEDDCDSWEKCKCKSLVVPALASIFTFAKRCIPALAYLDEVREYMANLEDPAITSLKNNVLPPLDYPFPKRVNGDKIADFVDPATLLWLEELDGRYNLWLKGGHQETNVQNSYAWKPW